MILHKNSLEILEAQPMRKLNEALGFYTALALITLVTLLSIIAFQK